MAGGGRGEVAKAAGKRSRRRSVGQGVRKTVDCEAAKTNRGRMGAAYGKKVSPELFLFVYYLKTLPAQFVIIHVQQSVLRGRNSGLDYLKFTLLVRADMIS